MGLFERKDFAHPDDDAGVMIDGLGRALVMWTAMQDRAKVTVAEAALAFNTTPAVIHEACEDAMWITAVGVSDDPMHQYLELDGE